MFEFITEYFNYIANGFELFAALTAVICYKTYKNTSTRYFIYFLCYIVFVETVGIGFFYFSEFPVIAFLRDFGLRSVIWYNIFWMFGSVLFVMYYFHSLMKPKLYKTTIKIAVLVFMVAMLGHFCIYPDMFLKTHASFYQLSGALATIFCIALYFIQLLKSDAIVVMFTTFGFYASVGLFVWWLIVTPVLFFDVYNTTSDWDFANLKRRIFLFANIFMYTCFSVGLIISKPQLKND